jgi:alkylation response protein AidB-like acyl-CoA dehydrogenase
MAGAARRVLDMTVQYVSGRKQFGRPVGSFQAIQHRCADMAVMLQGSRHTAYRAAWALTEGRPAAREVALAKMAMNEALPRICSIAHQCHGAIGFTWDYDLHLFTRRAVAWRAEYGGAALHREALAAAMGL